MTLQEYNTIYVKDGYHKKHNQNDKRIDRDLFLEIIRCARQMLTNKTVGDKSVYNGNTTLFKIHLSENRTFILHVDTTVESLREFYENRENPWVDTQGRGGGTVLTNRLDQKHVPGFYVYKLN